MALAAEPSRHDAGSVNARPLDGIGEHRPSNLFGFKGNRDRLLFPAPIVAWWIRALFGAAAALIGLISNARQPHVELTNSSRLVQPELT